MQFPVGRNEFQNKKKRPARFNPNNNNNPETERKGGGNYPRNDDPLKSLCNAEFNDIALPSLFGVLKSI